MHGNRRQHGLDAGQAKDDPYGTVGKGKRLSDKSVVAEDGQSEGGAIQHAGCDLQGTAMLAR